MYLGSDAIALAPFTDTITYLEDGDWVALTRNKAEVFDLDGRKVDRPAIKSVASSLLVDKGNYRHFHGQGNSRAARGDQPHARRASSTSPTGAS